MYWEKIMHLLWYARYWYTRGDKYQAHSKINNSTDNKFLTLQTIILVFYCHLNWGWGNVIFLNKKTLTVSLLWRHNGHNGISNHQLHDCLLNPSFRHRSKKTSKLCITGLCAGNSPVTGEFPAQMASNAENVSMWWRHHVPVSQYRQQVYMV